MLCACSVATAAVLLGRDLDRGWLGWDDGSLAQSAERVLIGELPHREYADLYTGLLSFLNAAVFAVLGHDLFNLRIPLFVGFLAFAGCFFALSRRLIPHGWAFVATVAAICWSVPIYPAPMPSWYLLFLSTYGMYFLVRFFESGNRAWVLVAGVCGGLAVAIKVVGVWYVVAATLALLAAPLVEDGTGGSLRRSSRRHATFVVAAATLALALVVAVASGHPRGGEIAALVVPLLGLCVALVVLGWREWTRPERVVGGSWPRETLVFAMGVSVPLVIMAVPYVFTGSFRSLVEGVLITPRSRFEFASWNLPGPWSLLRGLPLAALLVARPWASERARRLMDVGASALALVVVVTATTTLSTLVFFGTIRALASLIVIVGALAILWRKRVDTSPAPEVVALFVLVGGFSALVQFPLGAPIYFCYAAPLLLLAAIAALRRIGAGSGLFPAALLVALAIFGFRLVEQPARVVGLGFKDSPPTVVLDSKIAGVRVRPAVARELDRVRSLVALHRVGADIFAGPDAPEIYYVSGSRNPTPVLLEFLDSTGSTRGHRLLHMLEERRISVVVLNHGPTQSRPLGLDTIGRIRSAYPESERVGRFEVRWQKVPDALATG